MANIRVTELDFDTIKSNLKNFLKNQSTFNSYDFEGSALSVLIDLLAYNTHYNAYLANMLANEMFLDSAVKRESAVSIARHLGFVPRSARGAIARVNFSINDTITTASSATLEKNSVFLVNINGQGYTFVSTKAVNAFSIGGVFNFSNVEIKQGTPEIFRYTVTTPGPAEKYVIPNENIDTSSIVVSVQNSSTDTTSSVYRVVTSIDGIDGSLRKGKVCFLEENQYGKYQIYFGDGSLGYKLSTGNIVNIEYLITDGEDANSLPTETISFTLSTIPTNLSKSTFLGSSILSRPAYGASRQSINDIKFLAPLIRAAQDRAVTKNDYEALILNNKPNIESVSVWGGEQNDPPVYGKVFISAKPVVGLTLDEPTKEDIKNTILSERKVLAITPEIVDPEYLHVGMNINVKYNQNLASTSTARLLSLIRLRTENYFNEELEKFNKSFIYFKFLNEIENLDDSLTSILVALKMQRRMDIRLNVNNEFSNFNSIKFYNKILPNSFKSTYFTYQDTDNQIKTVFFKDNSGNPPNYNGSGTIELWQVNTTNFRTSLLLPEAGTINYSSGEAQVRQFIPRGFPSGISELRFMASVQEGNFDIGVSKNILITLDNSPLNPLVGLDAGLNIFVTPVSE